MIGSRLPRLEDHALLTGRGRFVDDVAIADPLHAAFVRSPHPHALIRAVRTAAARALPGVFAVLALDDIAPAMARRRMVRTSNSGTPLDRCWAFALADGEVSYVGEPVAIVLAANRYLAEDAAALVDVDYEVLACAADCRKAALAGAPAVRREVSSNVISLYRLGYGDIDAAFANAAHVFRESFWPHRGGAHSIEGRGIAVEYRASDGSLTVYASTQKAHDLLNTLASSLGVDENRLRVATPDIGGGFGPKLCVYAEDVAVTASAKLVGRSVKWIEDRREHFLGAVQERDQHWFMEIALDAAGRIVGLRGRPAINGFAQPRCADRAGGCPRRLSDYRDVGTLHHELPRVSSRSKAMGECVVRLLLAWILISFELSGAALAFQDCGGSPKLRVFWEKELISVGGVFFQMRKEKLGKKSARLVGHDMIFVHSGNDSNVLIHNGTSTHYKCSRGEGAGGAAKAHPEPYVANQQ